MSNSKTSDIILRVSLDENKVPEKIHWDATDNQVVGKEATAMMLSVWDPNEENTMRVDLWT